MASVSADSATNSDPFLLSSDDDNTIKDILSKFSVQQQQQPSPSPATSKQQPPTSPPPSYQSSVDHNDPNYARILAQQQYHQQQQQQEVHHPAAVHAQGNEFEESYIDRFVRMYAADVQLIIAFFVISIVCCMLPIRTFFNQYIMSIESIPFSDVFIKSVVLALMCYVAVLVIKG